MTGAMKTEWILPGKCVSTDNAILLDLFLLFISQWFYMLGRVVSCRAIFSRVNDLDHYFIQGREDREPVALTE